MQATAALAAVLALVPPADPPAKPPAPCSPLPTLVATDYWDQLREAEELAACNDGCGKATKELIDRLRYRPGYASVRFPEAVAASGEPAAAEILRILKTGRGGTFEECNALVECLGRMGPAAKGALPALTRIAKDPKEDGYTKGLARVALANVGKPSDAEAEALARAIRDAGPDSFDVATGILRMGAGGWADGRLAKALATDLIPPAKSTARERDRSLQATCLGLLGDRGKPAARDLERLLPLLR